MVIYIYIYIYIYILKSRNFELHEDDDVGEDDTQGNHESVVRNCEG